MAKVASPWKFIDAVSRWANARADIAGLVLVGSHARGIARPESDIDLVLLSNNIATLLDEKSWVETFGLPVTVTTEHYGTAVSVRAFYEDGLEAEFCLVEPAWASLPLDPGTLRVLSDGARILYDEQAVLQAAVDAAL